MNSLLLIEDDPIICRSLKMALSLENFSVSVCCNLSDASGDILINKYDLILLDINLPDGKGYDFCKKLRMENNLTPIIAITANLDEETVVKTLGFGADDYVRKPFSTKELILRIKLRLKEQDNISQFKVDCLVIDLEKRMVSCTEGEINLPRKEFDLLVTFAKRLDHVLNREKMIEILDTGSDINDRTIDSHVSHLRSKLKKCSCHHLKIKSVYGLGYKMCIDHE